MATFFSHAWIALNFSNSSSPKHNYNIHFLQSLISHTNDCKKAMDPSSPWSTWRRAKWRAPAGSGAAPPRWWRPPSRSRSSNPPPSPCTSSSPSSTTHNTPKIKNRLATHEKQVLPRPQITPSNNSNGRENSRGSRSLRHARTRRPPGSCASWRRRRGAPRAAPPPPRPPPTDPASGACLPPQPPRRRGRGQGRRRSPRERAPEEASRLRPGVEGSRSEIWAAWKRNERKRAAEEIVSPCGGGGLITGVDLCVTATWGTWVCERCLTLMTRLLFWQAILLGVQPWSPGRQHASTNNFLSKMLHDWGQQNQIFLLDYLL